MIEISWRGPRLFALVYLVLLTITNAGFVNEAKASGAHHSGGAAMLRHWNEIAIDASGLDHTPPAPGETRVFGEQLGPGRSSRAMAIVHIAMFDAINAITGNCRTYSGIHPDPSASMDSAMAQAAHDTLVAMFPSQASKFDATLSTDLAAIPAGAPGSKSRGIALGHHAASAILGMRSNDGSQIPEPHIGTDFVPSLMPGIWRQDPISHLGLALGAYWGDVQPFVMSSQTQYRAPVPPAMTSPEYASAYDEAKSLGGDGIATPAARTAEQTLIGFFWAYDGTPSLCAPPRLYNQIAMHIADQMGTSSNVEQLARLLALVNTAMADAGISIWESKYFYQLWRPITGIRESDPGNGPTGLGDGNAATVGNPAWSPL